MISGMGTAFAFKRRSWKTSCSKASKIARADVLWNVDSWIVGGIITGGVDLEGNSFVDTLIAFFVHVLFTSFLFWVPCLEKL